MTALATTLNLEERLGRVLTTTEDRRADALLADASATIRAYTGQTITTATTTDRLKVRRSRLRLPQRPVTAVTTVTDDAGDAIAFTWLGADLVQIGRTDAIYDWAWERWNWSSDFVMAEVTYTHGYASVPDDIVGVCASVVLRALGQSPTMGGLMSESVEGYSYQIGATGAAGGLGLLPAEMAILDRYRRRAGYVDGASLR